VDKNDSACGNGGGSKVHCSIQSAVNAAQPGTAIRIRAASSPYTETVTVTKSGTAERPIIIEAEAGQVPVLTNTNRNAAAAIDIRGSHVVVRNLTFQTELSRSQRQYGILVTGNRNTDGTIIRNNRLHGVRGVNIGVFSGYNAQIYGNTITGARCDTNTWGGNRTWTTWQGIKVGAGVGKGADGQPHHQHGGRLRDADRIALRQLDRA
jgi:hypothetical protein